MRDITKIVNLLCRCPDRDPKPATPYICKKTYCSTRYRWNRNWRKPRILSVRMVGLCRDTNLEHPKRKARALVTPPTRNHLILTDWVSCLDSEPPSKAIRLLQDVSRCCS